MRVTKDYCDRCGTECTPRDVWIDFRIRGSDGKPARGISYHRELCGACCVLLKEQIDKKDEKEEKDTGLVKNMVGAAGRINWIELSIMVAIIAIVLIAVLAH